MNKINLILLPLFKRQFQILCTKKPRMPLMNMKKTAIIINTARGGVINETDLDKALREKIIFGAGIDVFEKEPIDLDNPLIKNMFWN